MHRNVCLRVARSIGVVSCFVFGAQAAAITGVWVGTFDIQPDATNRRPSKSFQLTVRMEHNHMSGELRGQDIQPSVQAIMNAGRFGKRFCFDVFDDGVDMRWCVEAKHDRLEGVWSKGPKGGPLLGGMGPGPRLFAIRGHRMRQRAKRGPEGPEALRFASRGLGATGCTSMTAASG